MQLALGTVQFGVNYGITNTQGKVCMDEARAILDYASAQSVSLLDTASGYGQSEHVLGQSLDQNNFKIVTKTPHFQEDKNADVLLEQAFFQSLRLLNQSCVYGLLVHNSQNLLESYGSLIWKKMQELKAAGLVDKIGVSVYTATQARAITELYPIDLIQLPINVFDQRLIFDGTLSYLKSLKIEVHARSLFLQGLLLEQNLCIEKSAFDIKPRVKNYFEYLKQRALSPLQGALNFIASVPQLDYGVVGVCSRAQLEEIVMAYTLSKNNVNNIDFSVFAINDEKLLNPALWGKA
jgi:aryl-alcohol dehydrogenase-like predicted oxidoreductase